MGEGGGPSDKGRNHFQEAQMPLPYDVQYIIEKGSNCIVQYVHYQEYWINNRPLGVSVTLEYPWEI